jgi:hypothetical protein
MSKTAFRLCASILTLLVFALSTTKNAEAALFSFDLSGAYTSNLEREPDGESGFFVLTRFDGLASMQHLLRVPSHIGLILEDRRYSGGNSAQWGEVYIGSALYRRRFIELICSGTGTYVRDGLAPEDDFYAAALQTQAKIYLTPSIDLGVAHYVQWRNYANKVESPRAGATRRDHSSRDMNTLADQTQIKARRERTQRTRLMLTWMPHADIHIMTGGSYSDNTASIAMERWYAWGGEMELFWHLNPAYEVQIWGDMAQQQYPKTRGKRADTISHIGARANYYFKRWGFYLGLEWQHNSSNIAAETYSVRTLTCGTHFYF